NLPIPDGHRDRRRALGARGTVGKWEWKAAAQNSADRGITHLYGQANTGPLNAALASSDPRTALNPFVDGPWGSADLLTSIYSNTRITSYKADATTVDAFARGPLAQLPAGPIEAVFGAEYEKSKLTRGFDASC